MKIHKYTIKDIANACDVSPSTVSRALNDNKKISASVTEKIKKVAKEMNYIRNEFASSLRNKKTNNIGVLIPDIENPFFFKLLASLENEANNNGYQIFIGSFDQNRQQISSILKWFNSYSFAGVIFTSNQLEEDLKNEFKKMNIPILMVATNAGYEYSYVTIDNYQASQEITIELLRNNKQNPIMLSFDRNDKIAGAPRQDGFLKICKNYNIASPKIYTIENQYDDSFKQIESLIKRGEKIDSIFCSSDIMAFGAINAIKKAGLKIPTDISVTGFDNISFVQYFDPLLTTVDQELNIMGQKSMRNLILQINDGIKRFEIISHSIKKGESTN